MKDFLFGFLCTFIGVFLATVAVIVGLSFLNWDWSLLKTGDWPMFIRLLVLLGIGGGLIAWLSR